MRHGKRSKRPSAPKDELVRGLQAREQRARRQAALAPERAKRHAERIRRTKAELAFCMAELYRRKEEDADRAWIWDAKRKVAAFCLKSFDAQEAALPYQLTEEDKSEVLKSHPLLQFDDELPPAPDKQHAHDQWYRDIRTKVERYAESIAPGKSSTD